MKPDQANFYRSYGALLMEVDGAEVPESDVEVWCNLSVALDGSGDWAHARDDHYGVDPLMKAGSCRADRPRYLRRVGSAYRLGFSDVIGGGGYERGEEIVGAASQTVERKRPDLRGAPRRSGDRRDGRVCRQPHLRAGLAKAEP